MSHLSRKDFIKLTSWGFVATLLPLSEISAINSALEADAVPSKEGFEQARELAKKAKEFFYKHQYDKAEELYLECIRLAPNYIQFYDSLSNVYGAKNNHAANAELFRKALLKNPDKGQFYDRAARSLIRLEAATPKAAAAFKLSNKSKDSLLVDAGKLYKKAIEKEGNKKYLSEGLKKLELAKQKEQGILYAPKPKLKKEKFLAKREAGKALKQKMAAKSDLEIEALIAKMDVKKRQTLYVPSELKQQAVHIARQKKKYLRVLLDRNVNNASSNLALSQKIFDLDPSDSLSVFHLKKAYHANGKYYELIKERQKFADKHPTVYSYLGVIDAIQEAYEKRQVTFEALDNGIAIAKMVLEKYNLVEKTAVDVVDKMCKLYIAKRNYAEAETMLDKMFALVTSNSPVVVNKLLYRYAEVSLASGNFQKATDVLLIGLKQGNFSGTAYAAVKKLSDTKLKETFRHKTPLYHLLYKGYQTAGKREQAEKVLAQLQEFNPSDIFVKKRK